jgi:uncharacterized protein (TIGR01319 family)
MELALFVDFGSTYTKVTVVDLASEEIKVTTSSHTTVQDNIMKGLEKALTNVYEVLGSSPSFKYKIACSSAAGGLKIIAIGLVKELTAEAAKRAALGAGAKVLDVFSHELTLSDIDKIASLSPDIILLAGGTDGGNKENILNNAKMLGNLPIKIPVVIAGNRVAAPLAYDILTEAGFEAVIVENVMPELNMINVEPSRLKIREIFLRRITLVKGLKKAETFLDGVVMPTPAAVLKAAELLAKGTSEENGLGELMVLDPGGATTDVYSIAEGAPTKAGITLKGLPEPFAKRTVEGDLGMRHSCEVLFETVKNSGIECSSIENFAQYVNTISREPSYLPQNSREKEWDNILGQTALKIAMERHVGHLEIVYTPFGASYLQYGKDLTAIKHVIGTGGILINNERPLELLKKTIFEEGKSTILKPQRPQFWLDKSYILAAMGLLAEIDPNKALRIMKKYLNNLGGIEFGTAK